MRFLVKDSGGCMRASWDCVRQMVLLSYWGQGEGYRRLVGLNVS